MGKNKRFISNKVKSVLDRLHKESWFPQNQELRKKSDLIISTINNEAGLSQEELKSILADCIEVLADFPIADKKPLERIISHITPRIDARRIDFYDKIDEIQEQIIRHIHDVLDILGHNTQWYTDDSREFGLIAREIVEKWDELFRYSEIYRALSLLVRLEDIINPIDEHESLIIISWIDDAIQESSFKAISMPYPVNISPYQRYLRLRQEIIRYYTDDCYVRTTGDYKFRDVLTNGYQAYIRKMEMLCIEYSEPSKHRPDITDEDINKWISFKEEGKALFRTLKNRKMP